MIEATWTMFGYTITSFGNGTSYFVKRENQEFFLQGHDASEWRKDYDLCDKSDKLEMYLQMSMENYGKEI